MLSVGARVALSVRKAAGPVTAAGAVDGRVVDEERTVAEGALKAAVSGSSLALNRWVLFSSLPNIKCRLWRATLCAGAPAVDDGGRLPLPICGKKLFLHAVVFVKRTQLTLFFFWSFVPFRHPTPSPPSSNCRNLERQSTAFAPGQWPRLWVLDVTLSVCAVQVRMLPVA